MVREQKVAEEIYLMLSAKLEEARITEAKEENVIIQVIDPAYVPDKKHSPSTTLNMAVAGFLALFAGVGLAFMREYRQSFQARLRGTSAV